MPARALQPEPDSIELLVRGRPAVPARTSLPISGAGRRGQAPPNPLQIGAGPREYDRARMALAADGWRSYATHRDRRLSTAPAAGGSPDPPTRNSEEPNWTTALLAFKIHFGDRVPDAS